jgi:hypothetical protein
MGDTGAPVDPTKCPKCGGTVVAGYGLAGGGMGAYWLCLDDRGADCDYFYKVQDEHAQEAPGE